MRVGKNTSLPVPTSVEDGEQSVMGESQAVNSALVRSVAVRDVDTMHVEAPEECCPVMPQAKQGVVLDAQS